MWMRCGTGPGLAYSLTVIAAMMLAGKTSASATAGDIEKRVIEGRKKVQSIHAVLIIDEDRTPGKGTVETKKVEVWLDGPRYRADTTPLSELHRYGKKGVTQVFCRDLQSGRAFYFEVGRTVVHSITLSPETMPLFRGQPDPRLLGFSTRRHPNLSIEQPAIDLESDISSPLLSRRELTYEKFGDRDVAVLTSTRLKTNGLHKVWVDTDQGHSVVGMEDSRTDDKGVKHRLHLKVEPVLDRHSHLWYPNKYTLTGYENDKVTSREVVKVESVTLNRSIPAATFSLKAAGAADGQPAVSIGSGPKHMIVQDGMLIVKPKTARNPSSFRDGEGPEVAPVQPPSPAWRAWGYGAATVFAGVVTVILLRRVYIGRARGAGGTHSV
jgi:hypothetical protein